VVWEIRARVEESGGVDVEGEGDGKSGSVWQLCGCGGSRGR
jgi:hypothetical protein